MITESYLDISNYTGVLTAEQVAFIDANYSGVVIGLQNADIARQQQAQLQNVDRAYYVDLPGRDLTIPETNAYVFVDIEVGCFTNPSDVEQAIADIEAIGCRAALYGNETSMKPVLGVTTILAGFPLWYANYQSTPPESPALPTPFNGWTECMMWQWSDKGVAGITADLNVLFVADPTPPPPAPAQPYVKDISIDIANRSASVSFSDGTAWPLVIDGGSAGVITIQIQPPPGA